MKTIFVALLLLFISTKNIFASDERPDFKIQQIASGVYLHTSFKVVDGFGLVDSNGLIVIVHNDAYIVDTPWSMEDTEKLVKWLEERHLAIKGSISTHFHDDRTVGIEFLNSKSIPTYASTLTNELLKKAGRTQAVNSFANGDFGWVEDQIEVFYPGPGHSQDNVVVWLPKQQMLFGGCFIRAKETKKLGNVSDAVISAWSKSAEKLESKYKNAKLVVPGHGDVGDGSLIEHTRDLAVVASSHPKQPAANAPAD